MRNILVTGGTGCVGSNLAEELVRRGYDVRILRRVDSDLRALEDIPVTHHLGDIRDRDSLVRAMEGCDTVFHTAGLVSFRRDLAALQHEINVLGTRNVVEACLVSGVTRLVHTSSVAAIGYASDREPATEETPYNWGTRSGYRYTKFLAEQEIRNGIVRGLDAVIVNPAVIIGERDIRFHGGQILRDVRKGRVPFYIKGGMNVVYVGDVVRGEIQAALAGSVGERYILAGENLTHKEVFEKTAKVVGGRAPFAELPLPLLHLGAKAIERVSALLHIEPLITPDLVAGAGRHNWFSCEKAKRALGYQTTPFERAVEATYAWYVQHGFL